MQKIEARPGYNAVALRGRLMVGRLTLDQVVGVRVPAPQLHKNPAHAGFLLSGRAAIVRGGNVGGNSRRRCYGRPRAGRRNTDVQPLNRRRRSRRYAPRHEASNRDAAKHPDPSLRSQNLEEDATEALRYQLHARGTVFG